MSGKGNDRHLKRLAVGAYPRIGRKAATYLAKPRAGRHSLGSGIALLVILRDKLSIAATAREARRVVRSGSVAVNGKVVRDERYAVGFGDVITLKPTGETYTVGVTRREGIDLQKAGTGAQRVAKVVGKYLSAGKKVMVRLLDGSVVGAGNDLRVNDSVVLDGSKITKTIKFETGAKCLVISGTHASRTGTIKEISKGSAVRDATVKIDSDEGPFETLVDNVMVVGA